MRSAKPLTPAEKGQKTREENKERAARRARIHAENAPVRKAWKRVRIMIRALGAYVRPSVLPQRFRRHSPEAREARIAEIITGIRAHVEKYEIAKMEVAKKRREGKSSRRVAP